MTITELVTHYDLRPHDAILVQQVPPPVVQKLSERQSYVLSLCSSTVAIDNNVIADKLGISRSRAREALEQLHSRRLIAVANRTELKNGVVRTRYRRSPLGDKVARL